MPCISIELKKNESIERALKRFRSKFERAGVLRTFRGYTSYTKPSVLKRNVKLRAIYRQKCIDEDMQ